MRKLALLVTALIVSVTTFAQRTVTGKVVEQDTQEAVIQATAALLRDSYDWIPTDLEIDGGQKATDSERNPFEE